MMLFFTAMIAKVQAADEIDIGVYATSCSDFEVRLSSQFNITNTSLTNVQFAIKYPASVTLGNITYPYPVLFQYTTTVGTDKYSVFIGVDVPITNWVSGTEYTIITFGIDHATSSAIELIVGNDTWTSNNNISYYAELLGIDKTGAILTGASVDLRVHNINLGRYYCKIQEAVEDAAVSNTIEVSTGTFNENVTIDVAGLIVKNAVSAAPVVQPTTGIAFIIAANNVTIDGFEISHATLDDGYDVGIYINLFNNAIIQNNLFTNNSCALALIDAGNNDVLNNTFTANALGIFLDGNTDGLGHFDGGGNGPFYSLSLNNDIIGNTIQNGVTVAFPFDDDGVGIYVDAACEGNEFDNNDIINNAGTGYYAWKASNNMITNNEISGNDTWGIELMGSSGNTITGNTLAGNTTYGINIRSGALSSTSNIITGNTITGSYTGIWLRDDYTSNNYIGTVNGNTISGNKIFNNTNWGIFTEQSPPGDIYAAENNWWGDPTGPYCNPYNTCGLGNDVSANVDFIPWWEDVDMTISSGDLPVKNITKSPEYLLL